MKTFPSFLKTSCVAIASSFFPSTTKYSANLKLRR